MRFQVKTSSKINLDIKYFFIIIQFSCLSECHITFIFAFDLTSNQYFQKLTLIYKKHLSQKNFQSQIYNISNEIVSLKPSEPSFLYITLSKVNRIFLPKLCNSNKQLGWVKFPFLSQQSTEYKTLFLPISSCYKPHFDTDDLFCFSFFKMSQSWFLFHCNNFF